MEFQNNVTLKVRIKLFLYGMGSSELKTQVMHVLYKIT